MPAANPHAMQQPMPTQTQQNAPQEHTDVIHDTQFDYYGQLLATASSDRTVGIHLARPGAPLQRLATLCGHEGPVWMVSWAHPRFGSVVASASYDQKAIVWKDGAAGSQRWAPVHVVDIHKGSVNAVQWGPEELGPVLATASSDGTVAVTAYRNGAWQESVKVSNNANLTAHAMGATSVSFAPSKSQLGSTVILASGGCDAKIRLWVSSMQEDQQLLPFELLQVLDGHDDWIRDVAFCPVSPASRYVVLAACGQDKCVTLYRKPWEHLSADVDNVRSGNAAATKWESSVVSFDEPVWRLSWAPSGEMLVATTAGSEAFVLRGGADFTEPWIKTPLSEYQQ